MDTPEESPEASEYSSHGATPPTSKQSGAPRLQPSWLLPMAVLVISESLFLLSKIFSLSVRGPILPTSLGFIKDLLDVPLVVIFPWHGWVLAAPLMVALLIGTQRKYLVLMYVLSTASTYVISSYFDFGSPDFWKVARDLATYSVINFVSLSIAVLAVYSLKASIKSKRS